MTKSNGPLFGPLFIKPTRPMLAFWAALALLNLLAAIIIAENSQRALDLESIMRWGHAWLVDGLNIYQPAESIADYPPNAIVLLSVWTMRWTTGAPAIRSGSAEVFGAALVR